MTEALKRPCGRAFALLGLVAGLLTFGAWLDAPLHAQAKLVVKIGTLLRADSPLGRLMESVARDLETRSSERLHAKRFADGALSVRSPALERVASGEVQAYVASFSELMHFLPALSALGAPLLFDDIEDLRKRRLRAVADAAGDALAARGIALWALGPCDARVLASREPLATAKLERLRVREPEGAAMRAFHTAVGSPLAPSSEAPDVIDTTLSELIASRQTHWVRHVTLIDHAIECAAVVMSQRWLDGLPEAMRKELQSSPDAPLALAQEETSALRASQLAQLVHMGIKLEQRAPRLRSRLKEPARAATQSLVREHGAEAARIVAAARR